MTAAMRQNPIARAVLVGVLAALLFLALKAVTGGVETADYVTGPAVAVGAAVGYHFGTRRKERRRRGG